MNVVVEASRPIRRGGGWRTPRLDVFNIACWYPGSMQPRLASVWLGESFPTIGYTLRLKMSVYVCVWKASAV